MSSAESPAGGGSERLVERPRLVSLGGVPMSDVFVENWAAVECYQAHPRDILIATYPKAGTTWVQEMVDQILQGGDPEKCQRGPIHTRIPFLEFGFRGILPFGTESLALLPSPKVIKTHLPFQLLPKSFLEQHCKIIYCARNPKDNLVSYFHFDRMNMIQPEPGSWEEYFGKFLEGNVNYGLWHDHVKGWWANRDKHDILYMFYEDIKEDPKREIVKMIKFLGKELPDLVIDGIVRNTTFESMKDNPMSNYSTVPDSIFDRSISHFMRKGTVGDWKNHFTVAQDETFEADYRRRMGDTDLRFRTELRRGGGGVAQ